MNIFTYADVITRADAVVDQVEMFLLYAGISEENRSNIVWGVDNRCLSDVGVYLSRNDKRFLEAEIGVDWDLYSDLAKLTPTIRTDLPGWEQGAAPEVRVIGRRFGQKAQALGMTPGFWVRFTQAIRNDPSRHRELCSKIGVDFHRSPPEWETPPRERSLEIQDLPEVHAALRDSQRK